MPPPLRSLASAAGKRAAKGDAAGMACDEVPQVDLKGRQQHPLSSPPQQQLAGLRETFGAVEYSLLLLPALYVALRAADTPAMPLLFAAGNCLLCMVMRLRSQIWPPAKPDHVRTAAPSRRRSVGGAVWNHFTSTKCGTDGHRPQRSVVKGASCWLFALPAVDIVWLTWDRPDKWDMYDHEVYLLAVQCLLSFMADHVMIWEQSVWHPLDRFWAALLTFYGFTKQFVLEQSTAGKIAAWLGVASTILAFTTARRRHGLKDHHLYHALFHVCVVSGWISCTRADAHHGGWL
eukprot:TRINITY_DN4103_c0_g1_i2.p2 TRINITY_DN4103_c0_g1~~TRINITY_DN4103_c0_g1_i2.p2  ORF type:complete len:290 (+),score=80.07 TRINITY_DN4103_c0_g1_i2:112-981(+)